MSAVDEFVAAILQAFIAKQRRVELLRDVILLDFQLDRGAQVARGDVHSSLALRLNAGVSNELVAEAKQALALLDGVKEVTRRGRRLYSGLRARGTREPTARANLGVKKSAEQVRKQRQTWARKRSATART